MTAFRIKVTNVKFKDGKLVKTSAARDASAKIRERKSKKVRVVRRGKA